MPWTRDQVKALHAKNERGEVSDKVVNKMDREVKQHGFRKMAGGGSTGLLMQAIPLVASMMNKGGYVNEEESALDRLLRKYGHDGDTGISEEFYSGGAIEPVYEPLDEQDSAAFEEETEEERHHKELLRAFAGALAKQSGRR
ncbi:MAG TPA: hypothetical protein VMT56_00365 [Candidatus Bathyarchaeia archaeon]|nr:hypothetical protein [Candidatus Bathyarchaeia archaeon]